MPLNSFRAHKKLWAKSTTIEDGSVYAWGLTEQCFWGADPVEDLDVLSCQAHYI